MWTAWPSARSKRLITNALSPNLPMPLGILAIRLMGSSCVSGTSIPNIRASSIIEYSFSGTASNRDDGNFTIQEPPWPVAGIVKPPFACCTAENFNCTPANEKRIGSSVFVSSSMSWCTLGGKASPSAGTTVIAPAKSCPSTHNRKNSRAGLTPARSAR